MFCKKIKFEKIKRNKKIKYNNFTYYSVQDSEVQRIVLEYCLNNNIEIKSITINNCNCCVKLKCSTEEANKFVLYLLNNYFIYFKNFKFY